MIAADTSSISSYFRGESGDDVEQLAAALAGAELALCPVVVTELLSAPLATQAMLQTVALFARLPITEGYWERAGQSRRLVLQQGLKGKVADALIAQSCIDHDVPLITRDADFRHFAKYCGLKLV